MNGSYSVWGFAAEVIKGTWWILLPALIITVWSIRDFIKKRR